MSNPQSGENLASFMKRIMGEQKPPRPVESMYRKKKKRKA